MLNNIYCVLDEKQSPKHAHIVYFSSTEIWRGEKKTKFTANTALKYTSIVSFSDKFGQISLFKNCLLQWNHVSNIEKPAHILKTLINEIYWELLLLWKDFQQKLKNSRTKNKRKNNPPTPKKKTTTKKKKEKKSKSRVFINSVC